MSDLSQQIYTTLTHPSTMVELVGSFTRDSKNQAIALLQKSGVAISNSAPVKQVQLAYLKAIKDSASFRQQLSTQLTGYVNKVKRTMGAKNFIGNTNLKYYNDIGDVFGGYIDPGSSGVMVDPSLANSSVNSDMAPIQPYSPLQPVSLANTGSVAPGSISGNPNAISSTVASPGSSSTSSSFWDTLGSIFSPKVIQTGITTGLQAYSTNLTAKANQTSEQNALAIEQTKLAQAQIAAQAPSSGLSTGWIIALSLIGIAGIIFVVVLATRKKK